MNPVELVQLESRVRRLANAEGVNFAAEGDGKWITLNGAHIFIKGGRIEKGPKGVAGKSLSEHANELSKKAHGTRSSKAAADAHLVASNAHHEALKHVGENKDAEVEHTKLHFKHMSHHYALKGESADLKFQHSMSQRSHADLAGHHPAGSAAHKAHQDAAESHRVASIAPPHRREQAKRAAHKASKHANGFEHVGKKESQYWPAESSRHAHRVGEQAFLSGKKEDHKTAMEAHRAAAKDAESRGDSDKIAHHSTMASKHANAMGGGKPETGGGLPWTRVAGDKTSAALSHSGPYVISHRPGEHTVSFRPPGKHEHIGTHATESEAKAAAENHAKQKGGGSEPKTEIGRQTDAINAKMAELKANSSPEAKAKLLAPVVTARDPKNMQPGEVVKRKSGAAPQTPGSANKPVLGIGAASAHDVARQKSNLVNAGNLPHPLAAKAHRGEAADAHREAHQHADPDSKKMHANAALHHDKTAAEHERKMLAGSSAPISLGNR